MADTKNKFTFIWKIKNCLAWNGKSISSPKFTIGFLDDSKWRLDFYPNFSGNRKENLSECYLTSVKTSDTNNEPVDISYEFQIFDRYETVFESTKDRREFEAGKSWGLKITQSECLFEKLKLWCKDNLAIRCVIVSHKFVDEPQTIQCEALTTVGVESRIFQWDISNFGFLDIPGATTLPCPDETNDLRITMDSIYEDIIFNIQILNKEFLNKWIKLNITILDHIGRKVSSKCDVHVFDSMGPYQYPNFLRKEEFKFENVVLQKCLLFCEFTVSTGGCTASYIERYTHSLTFKTDLNAKPTLPMQNDFKKLYINKKFSDVKLRADNEEFLAHKAVLAARSPVFSTMFDQEMIETQIGIVDIDDIDGKTLSHLVEFLYTETMHEMDCDSALKLLLAADKYEVLTLVEECCSSILKDLRVENACEVITVADLINHESLKFSVLNYIFDNAERVLSLPNWTKLLENNVKLAADILKKLSEYYKQNKHS